MAALIGGIAVALHPVTDQFSQFLRLAFLRSPNFVTGVSGWTINQDGSAEFNNVTIRGGTIVRGTALFYSGAPVLGNLIASISEAGGTDSSGNLYLAGVTTYANRGGTFFATQLFNGLIQFSSAAGAGGPYSAGPSVSQSATDLALFSGRNILAQAPLVAQNTLTVAGGETADTIAVSSAQAAGHVLTVTDTAAAPTGSIVQLFAKAAADNTLGIDVTGDAVNRFVVDSNGKITWGTGALARDTDLFRGGAGVLQTDSTLAITNQAVPAVLAGAAQLYAATGQIAAGNPQGLQVNLSGAQLGQVNVNTVTQTAFTSLASATVPAADAVVGATYKIRAKGTGTWGSTQQQLNLGARFGAAATNVVAQASIMATAFAISAAFAWQAEVEAMCVTTGAGGTWIVSITGCVTQTANAILPGTAADNSVPFAIVTSAPITLDTTVAEILGISASWGSTTGAPTISKRASIFGREA